MRIRFVASVFGESQALRADDRLMPPGFGSMFAASATSATDDGLAGLVGATYPPHQYSSHSEMCAGHVGR